MSGSDLRAEGASVTGGPTDPYARWETIPWENVERHVSRMQTRIAKAARDGRVEVARKEQRRLVRSYDARLLAVRIVTTNRGGRTPGVDGSLWSAPKDKLDAAASLRQKGYRARPLRRVRIPKKGKRGLECVAATYPCRQVRPSDAKRDSECVIDPDPSRSVRVGDAKGDREYVVDPDPCRRVRVDDVKGDGECVVATDPCRLVRQGNAILTQLRVATTDPSRRVRPSGAKRGLNPSSSLGAQHQM